MPTKGVKVQEDSRTKGEQLFAEDRVKDPRNKGQNHTDESPRKEIAYLHPRRGMDRGDYGGGSGASVENEDQVYGESYRPSPPSGVVYVGALCSQNDGQREEQTTENVELPSLGLRGSEVDARLS